jgi:hypothetical protein
MRPATQESIRRIHQLIDYCRVNNQSIDRLEVNVNGDAAKGNETVEGVVLAADGRSRAARASSTDHSDGVASKTDKGGNVLDNDAEEAKESLGGVGEVTRLLGGLAALNGAGGAVAGWQVGATSRGGSRDGGEGRGEEDR